MAHLLTLFVNTSFLPFSFSNVCRPVDDKSSFTISSPIVTDQLKMLISKVHAEAALSLEYVDQNYQPLNGPLAAHV